MTTNITDRHREVFDAISSGDYENFALVSTTFDGQPTAAIAVIQEENGEFFVQPIAVFITDDMFGRMTDPAEGMDD